MSTTPDVAVLLTGVGKRYALVSAFAQIATTIAADPNPLAPARYAAHHYRAVPRFDDPGYVPALQELCEEFNVGAVVPLTDLDLELLGHARAAGRLPAFVPDGEIARATFDKYETHLLLERHGLPSPPTVLPGEPVASYPVMVKPRWGSGARSIFRAEDGREAEFLAAYIREPAMIQRAMNGPEFSMDVMSDLDGRCLSVIPRTMIESRGGESIKGTTIDDPELVELGRTVRRDARLPRPLHGAGVPRRGDRPRHHRRQHALRWCLPGAPLRGPTRPHLPRADRRARARRDGRAPPRRVPLPGSPSVATTGSSSSAPTSHPPAATSSTRPAPRSRAPATDLGRPGGRRARAASGRLGRADQTGVAKTMMLSR